MDGDGWMQSWWRLKHNRPRQSLRLVPVWTALAGTLLVAIVVLFAAVYSGLEILHVRHVQHESHLTSATFFDLVKLAFALVAGIGGLVALVVSYRRQRIDEAGALREATKLHSDRFAVAVGQIGNDIPAVRLGGIYALAGLADDAPTDQLRQTCIDVLCAYLRLPYEPDPGDGVPDERRQPYVAFREVRHTVVRIIGDHLRPEAAVSWQGHDFDFTGAIFDGGDLKRAVFPNGKVSFAGAEFRGEVSFEGAVFSGADVAFRGAKFSGDSIVFRRAEFAGGEVDFAGAIFAGAEVDFGGARFSGGRVNFSLAKFASGKAIFRLAHFSGCYLAFWLSEFSGAEIWFMDARFSGGTTLFCDARFVHGSIIFEDTTFSGGKVIFGSAALSRREIVALGSTAFPLHEVYFDDANGLSEFTGVAGASFMGGNLCLVGSGFMGADVDFTGANFRGGRIDFAKAYGEPPKGIMSDGAGSLPVGVSWSSHWKQSETDL